VRPYDIGKHMTLIRSDLFHQPEIFCFGVLNRCVKASRMSRSPTAYYVSAALFCCRSELSSIDLHSPHLVIWYSEAESAEHSCTAPRAHPGARHPSDFVHSCQLYENVFGGTHKAKYICRAGLGVFVNQAWVPPPPPTHTHTRKSSSWTPISSLIIHYQPTSRSVYLPDDNISVDCMHAMLYASKNSQRGHL